MRAKLLDRGAYLPRTREQLSTDHEEQEEGHRRTNQQDESSYYAVNNFLYEIPLSNKNSQNVQENDTEDLIATVIQRAYLIAEDSIFSEESENELGRCLVYFDASDNRCLLLVGRPE